MDINVEDLNVSRQSVSVDETRFSRLETLVEMLVQQGLEDKKKTNTLQESFADGRLNYDEELVTDKNTRRSSMLLHEVAKTQPSTISSMTTVAIPKRLETKAILTQINFLTLRQFQHDYAVYMADPGSQGQNTLIWNDYYIQARTRARAYRRLEQFNNIYMDSLLLQKLHPDWRLRPESSLACLGQDEIVGILEVSVIPHSPYEYESALREICESEIDLNKLSLSPSAAPYYLSSVKRVIDLIRAYDKLVPETIQEGQKRTRMPYNLGPKKSHAYGTKGTTALISDALMTPDLQHAVANMQTVAVPATNLAEHLSQLEDATTMLMKVYDKLKMWLLACQKHESKQKQPKANYDKHQANQTRLERAELDQDMQPAGESLASDSTTTETNGTETHEVAAIDATELKKTPCYAFIQGNCTSGKECARSHDKKELEQFLQEQLTTVRKM
jgi:hypothetical protein